MNVSTEGKKIVVYDVIGPHARENLCFDPSVATPKWRKYGFSTLYLYDECLKRNLQLITPDVYLVLPHPKPKAICVRIRPDTDMTVSLALRKQGVTLAVIGNWENPFYSCQFYWNLPKLTSYFDHSFVMAGVKEWVPPSSRFHAQYTPHGYLSLVREIPLGFRGKKLLTLMQGNARAHWLRRLYIYGMNFIKPMPHFVRREGYLDRLEAIRYFSRYPDFDLYGHNWDKPVRYTHRYDDAVKKSWRGEPVDKFKTMRQYKFSLCFENSYLGGYVQYMNDSLYAGAVPVYWGAPDIADMFPANCFIDFRKFGCDFARLDAYLRTMDEREYNGYIKNINAFIASPTGGRMFSQERYVSDMIALFDSYFP